MGIDASKINHLGKSEWRDMLRHVAAMHERCLRPALPPFVQPWEEIGPGYCYGPAFGHWDIVHAILDVIPFDPEHARRQIENNLVAQQEDGLIPGSLWLREGKITWNTKAGHPPVWPYGVQDYVDSQGSAILPLAYRALVRQIAWFEQHRRAAGQGFFYTDILDFTWESGVDEGIRFLNTQPGPFACVDATCHVYALYRFAQQWGTQLGEDTAAFAAKAEALRDFIQQELFSEETGFFHDIWSVRDPKLRCLSFEGMWPVVVGAATPAQARRVIEENLMNPKRFFSTHPITSVSMEDSRFELRCWRGPAWNSMTYWAARGCLSAGYADAAAQLLERALDQSAKQFDRTCTVWEFYHPHGGRPEEVQRKPSTPYNTPCPEYLGHCPLLIMARTYDQIRAPGQLERKMTTPRQAR